MLPNSVDGWWLYKYYGPGVPDAATAWEARQALMKERLLAADPDVICLQETSDKSFASDFAFLRDAGYDCAIMSKGRMRPATFWKRKRLELCCADGSLPEPVAPPPDVSSPATPLLADIPLPSFIESSFTCKVTYEAWVKKTRDTAAKAAAQAAEATDNAGKAPAASAEEIALSQMTAVTTDAVRGGAVVLNGDRILTTMLRHVQAPDDTAAAPRPPPPPPVFVLNCHLSAGSEARRRLRQVTDALDAIRKLLSKLTPVSGGGGGGSGGGSKGGKAKGGGGATKTAPGSLAPPVAVVVCGDFNSQGRSGVRELLMAGEVLPAFRESGDPTEDVQGFSGEISREEVTSKAKKQPFGPFADASDEAYKPDGSPPRPPTIVAAELMGVMVDRSVGDGKPSAALRAKLDAMFDALSTDGATLSVDEEAKWLMLINKATTRGSEMRKAKELRERRAGSVEGGGGGGADARLHREDFYDVYADELAQGKYWGVEHDIRVVVGEGLATPTEPPFTATFDYLYYSSYALRLKSMLPALTAEQYSELLKPGGSILPNAWFPSDHLPVAAALEFVSPGDALSRQ